MNNYRRLFASGTIIFALAGIITSVTTAATAHPRHRGLPPSAIDREVQRSRPASLRDGRYRAHP